MSIKVPLLFNENTYFNKYNFIFSYYCPHKPHATQKPPLRVLKCIEELRCINYCGLEWGKYNSFKIKEIYLKKSQSYQSNSVWLYIIIDKNEGMEWRRTWRILQSSSESEGILYMDFSRCLGLSKEINLKQNK